MKKNIKLLAIVVTMGITTLVSCVKEQPAPLNIAQGDSPTIIADDCHNPSLISKNKYIPMVHNPVCGCDGKTYMNEFEAVDIYGITHYTRGACKENNECIDSALIPTNPSERIIPTYYEPVCGCNNVTYSNQVEAKVNGVKSYTKGACNKNASNDCIDTTLIPKENVVIPAYYLPVCGCDGVTYSNSVDADVHGVVKYTNGACGQQNDSTIWTIQPVLK
jgi:hypothetical protein